MSISNTAKVGMVVVAAFILLAIVTVEMGVWRKKAVPGVPYYIIFDNVAGLLPGAQVLKAGVSIGKVTGLTIVNTDEPAHLRDKVRVTITVKNPNEKLTKNSTYSVSTNLMGEKWLEISPKIGPELQPATHVGKPWEDDYAYGITPVTMDRLMLDAETAVKKLDIAAASFNEIMGDPKIQKEMKETILSISALTQNLNKLSSTANQGMDRVLTKVDGLLDDADVVMAHVDHMILSSDREINGMMSSLRTITNKNSEPLGKIVKNMELTSHNLNLAMQSMQKIAGDPRFGESVITTLDNISQLSTELKSIAEDLHGVTSDTEIKDNLKGTIKETRETIEGINQIIKRFKGGAGIFNTRLAQLDAEITHNGDNEKLYGNANLNLLPYSSSMMRIGVDNIGTDNYLNLQYGKNYGSIRPRVGIIRSKLGVGADAFAGKDKNFELSIDAYNTSDLQVDLLGKYVMKNGFYITGGIRDTFDTKQGVVGIGKRF